MKKGSDDGNGYFVGVKSGTADVTYIGIDNDGLRSEISECLELCCFVKYNQECVYSSALN